MSKTRGGIRSGYAAVKKKTGIHGLSPEQTKKNALKANNSFRAKMRNPEFRKLHRMKIRYGRVAARFNKLPHPAHESFGFY
jgi:hypothetical protein